MSNFYLGRNQIWENTEFWKEHSERNYVACIQDLISSKPFGNRKFYIYSFVKRVDDMSGVKKMYHQPRLTRPEPLPGTTLMKVDPSSPETATIIWTLPNQENFGLYKAGKMFSDPFVHECIETYLKNPRELMRADPDDLNDEQIKQVYKELKQDLRAKKNKR
jgi:hypothetical protein